MKKIMVYLTLCLYILSALPTSAQQKTSEMDKKTLGLIDQILNIPAQTAGTSQAQNESLKELVARALIQRFALERTGKTSGLLTPENIRAALDEINLKLPLYAESKGKKWEEFSKTLKGNPGYEMFQKMQKALQNK